MTKELLMLALQVIKEYCESMGDNCEECPLYKLCGTYLGVPELWDLEKK